MEKEFKKITPEDLYRAGDKDSPKMDNVRTPEMVEARKAKTNDVDTFEKNGKIYVNKLSGGVSAFNQIRPKFRGVWWQLPKEEKIPVGLVVVRGRVHQDIVPAIHYTIEALNDMPLTDFKRLLKKFGSTAIRLD